MSSNKPPSKTERREAARAQALALKKQQEAADRRSRLITLSVLGVVVAALIVVVVFLFVRDNQRSAQYRTEDIPLSEVADVPAPALADGGIPIGTDRVAGGPQTEGVPTVGIWLDYMCSACGHFERINIGDIESFIAEGTANVVLYPISILDRMAQGTQFSTRAAAAAAWIADRAPQSLMDFHVAMFENEPAEGTPGHSNAEIAAIAREAGVPGEVAAAIESGESHRTFGQWVFSATREATTNDGLRNPETGSFGTPTVTLDGERWGGNWLEDGALAAAVTDATE